MPLSWRDSLASLFVALGVVIWAAWAIGSGVPGFVEVAPVAIAVLVLGVAASVSAVVPGWGELIHGSRAYFGAASAVGVVAAGAGLLAVINGDATALAVLIVTTVALWAMSTVRHLRIQRPGQRLQFR